MKTKTMRSVLSSKGQTLERQNIARKALRKRRKAERQNRKG